MSYSYSVCPACLGLIRENIKKTGGTNPSVISVIAKPISDVVNKITDAASEAAQRKHDAKIKSGAYEAKKKKQTVKYFNKLKKQRKRGKLPQELQTDEQLWAYAMQAAGLFN